MKKVCTHTNARFHRIVVLFALVSWIAAVPAAPPLATAAEGEVLYNGIRLPATWPPRLDSLPRDPVPPPYLTSPPEVIPIDVGRQLFIDDFLIEDTTLKRTYHLTEYHAANPVLKPDRPWETKTEPNPTAMVFSDGVWYDPADKLFKMWYMGGYGASTCYATSTDGIQWTKPVLDVVAGTNIVDATPRDSSTVWLDLFERDAAKRFKMSAYRREADALKLSVSPDGIHWSDPVTSGTTGDRSTFFFNPFRQVWVYSIRAGVPGDPRVRRYWESKDFLAGANWKTEEEPTLWTNSDNLDPRRDDLNTQCQLYNLDCVAYESVMIGLFSIWRGQPQDRAKPNEICIGFSRDGFHWYRPDHRPFIPVSEHYGDWNWGNVQSAGGGCLVVGDKLYFYCSGRSGQPGTRNSGVSSTGLALLRRDGFASLDAGADEALLMTRPLRFSGKHLFVNAVAGEGELRVEVLDANRRVIAPFSFENCAPIHGDGTSQAVSWKGADAQDLSSLAGKPVQFRFRLRNGRLYSFWVSPDASGVSRGYVAAGGPGFTGAVDEVAESRLRSP